jgi:hypothetical protein
VTPIDEMLFSVANAERIGLEHDERIDLVAGPLPLDRRPGTVIPGPWKRAPNCQNIDSLRLMKPE